MGSLRVEHNRSDLAAAAAASPHTAEPNIFEQSLEMTLGPFHS